MIKFGTAEHCSLTLFSYFRFLIVLVSLVVVAHLHVVDLSSPLTKDLVTSKGKDKQKCL